MDAKIDNTATLSESIVEPGTKIYKNVRIIHSTIGKESSVGDNTTVRNSEIGDHSQIQRYCDLLRTSMGRCSIVEKNTVLHDAIIGSFCEISWQCSIGGDNHNYHLPSIHHFYWQSFFGYEENDDSVGASNFFSKLRSEPCVLGNDIWVGSGVIVNRKVHVGNGAVLASGCVVTKDVPDYAIVGGVPARIIKYRFDEPTRKRLLNIAWWNWPDRVLKANRHLFEQEVNDELLKKMEAVCASL